MPHTPGPWEAEHVSDALRVIDLLEALKALRVNACQLGDFMYGAVRECSQDMIRTIDAAIAKAEGRVV